MIPEKARTFSDDVNTNSTTDFARKAGTDCTGGDVCCTPLATAETFSVCLESC